MHLHQKIPKKISYRFLRIFTSDLVQAPKGIAFVGRHNNNTVKGLTVNLRHNFNNPCKRTQTQTGLFKTIILSNRVQETKPTSTFTVHLVSVSKRKD